MGLPHVRSLVVVEKTSTPTSRKTKTGEAESQVEETPSEPEETVSYYLSSHLPRPAKFFAQLIRGHWGGCEIRNHWVRDAIFEEDATRSKNKNLNGNLAILRGTLVALKSRLAPTKSWPFIRELSGMKPSLPYNMICKNLFK